MVYGNICRPEMRWHLDCRALYDIAVRCRVWPRAVEDCSHWIVNSAHDDRYGHARALSRTHRCDDCPDDHVRILLCCLGGKRWKAPVFAFRPAHVEYIVLPFDQAVIGETLFQGVHEYVA